MAAKIPGDATQRIDFSKEDQRRVLEGAHDLIVEAYERLLKLGVKRPADNQFLREALLCSQLGLVWSGARGEADAETADGLEVEVKSTVYRTGEPLSFPTSRDIQPRVIARWRAAHFWIFGIFDPCERLLAYYRVSKRGMAPFLDDLESRMREKHAEGRNLNNPHLPFAAVRAAAEPLHISSGFREWQDARGRWTFGQVA